ncbi:multifunctional transcriptional regulator/nicotinamide-nucleotide adenylyltransferase/ribosylnicotinamide kinase NadR [Psychrobacter sp. I-STPA10]|uniref:multifunctional transcriptional regulator/nicotinamide-nucleotide adenylyltransferase/ribosylnicotinamide kinase NadR n=1 Tax=Psychrobacter sp. I-STPA10 TaxID=2585769 RepID=UPI0022A84D07|nr:multifunctional transcriptional regulator/nicotinamide-nucleotide adenylyltransferase/ribosylnicotinamide kinase NadR [Psychrobacter sp. I-STPA10]
MQVVITNHKISHKINHKYKEIPMTDHTNLASIGIMIGHFEPFHLGQMRSILHASGQVKTLHIIITPHPAPNPNYPVTLQDKARWLQLACAELPFIEIHTSDEIMLPVHDRFDTAHIDVHKSNAKLKHLISGLGLSETEQAQLFVAENHPLAQASQYTELYLPIATTPRQAEFNSFDIAQNPVAHWDKIHPEARSNYTKTVAIVGGESSGKTTLVHKLANYYGASFALEMGRLYVGTDLGGSEVGLQYSDYAPITLDHAEAVRVAKYRAPAPVTFVDTDFVTTQAFCEEYEGRTHPFVSACIDEFRFDHTLFLANNTPWVDDGMRSLGSIDARERFEARLSDIFARHQIQPHRISSPNYDERYQKAITYINQHIYHY